MSLLALLLLAHLSNWTLLGIGEQMKSFPYILFYLSIAWLLLLFVFEFCLGNYKYLHDIIIYYQYILSLSGPLDYPWSRNYPSSIYFIKYSITFSVFSVSHQIRSVRKTPCELIQPFIRKYWIIITRWATSNNFNVFNEKCGINIK